ncbi:MAG TPA: RNA-binding cell elongation regulator Jag/EloR [Acidimicrobiales bacterium]|nr:RNA-binding cell elongation regulator Jag/EloR [Acidimicrobiales bacterium]
MTNVEWVETTGKTIEEAEEAALDQLGIHRDDAEFEIVEEPRAGLFGRMRSEARVRARVAPKAPPPKQDRRPRRRSRAGGGGNGGGRDAARASAATATREDDEMQSDDDAGDASPAVETASGDHGERRAPTNGSGPRGGRQGRPDDDRPVLTVAEEGKLVSDFLEGLVDAFDLDAEVVTSPIDDETVQVDVQGDELGILVGPRGRTLGAVQELSRTILQRSAGGGFRGRVRVDVAGYRAKRHEALARFATKVAADVVDSGKATALEPMNPPDRKVVHDTVNEIEGVTTSSQGEEPRRYVVISPDT